MGRYLAQAILAVATFAVATASLIPSLVVQDDVQYNFDTHIKPNIKVPVALGVMSQCPDALICESIFDQVLHKVANKMDLTLRYIAYVDPSEPVFGARCLHGPQECAGNVQQLCVAKYSPSNWFEFVQCQNYEGRKHVGEPDVAIKCASLIDIDWNESKVGECAGQDGSGKGEEGIKLLQESAASTAEDNITKSCTVVINGEKVCVHDGTWKECEKGHTVSDFVKQIDDVYDFLNGD